MKHPNLLLSLPLSLMLFAPASAQWQLSLDNAVMLSEQQELTLRFFDHPDASTPVATRYYGEGEWRQQHNQLLINELPLASEKPLWAEIDDGNPLPLRRVELQAAATPGITFANGQPLNMDNNPISNLADPTNPQDAATKNYVDNLPQGDITSVTAGFGLSGGGVSGGVTLNVDNSNVQTRVSGSCAAGSSIRAIDINGSVTCEADDTGNSTGWSLFGNALTPGQFLGSTNAEPVEIHVNGKRALRIETGNSPNIIAGHPDNAVTAGVIGGTIAGGGAPTTNFGTPKYNRVTDNYSSIGGGRRNLAGNDNADTTDTRYATVSGGNRNTASGVQATVSGGYNNTASNSDTTIGGGNTNTASGLQATVSGGFTNTAQGEQSTISGGWNNSAYNLGDTIGGGTFNTTFGGLATIGGGTGNSTSGLAATVGGGYQNSANHDSATVPGGSENLAGGLYSLAAGQRAKVRHGSSANTDGFYSGSSNGDKGTFVWADSTNADFVSSGSDQFLVRASGGMGVGTNNPKTQLEVAKSSSGSNGTIINHVALIHNLSTAATTAALAIQLESPTINASDNFITFFNASNNAIGSIEGNATGGIALNTSGADFAEYLPAGDTDLEPGTVVALRQGKLWRNLNAAERVFVISTAPAVKGNSSTRHNHPMALVAFMGQTAVRVKGSVLPGDLLFASGNGYARAIKAGDLAQVDLHLLIGRALSKPQDGKVNALVGLPAQTQIQSLSQRVNAQQKQLARLDAENRQLREQLGQIHASLRQLHALSSATRTVGIP